MNESRQQLASRAVFISSTRIGSQELYADTRRKERLCQAVRGAGFAVSVVAPDGTVVNYTGGRFSDELTNQPRPRLQALTRFLLLGPVSAISVSWRALRLGRRFRPGDRAVILFNGGWMTLAAKLIQAMWRGSRLHLDVMGFSQSEVRLAGYRFWRAKGALFELLFGKAAKWADVITTINRAHSDLIAEKYHRSSTIVPDLLEANHLKELLALPLADDAAPDTLFFMGSISRQRLNLFLDVASRLQRQYSGLRVTITGSGAGLEQYKRTNHSNQTTFTGFVEDRELVALLRSATICYSDVWTQIGTPYKIIEYMAAGRAIVAHRSPSVDELIQNGTDGVLCQPNEASLEGALRALLDNPSMRRGLGANARAKAIAMHQLDTGRLLLDLYHLNQ